MWYELGRSIDKRHTKRARPDRNADHPKCAITRYAVY